MLPQTTLPAAEILRRNSHAFSSHSYSALLSAIGPAKVVLIGDSTHGTHDFYAHRANLTERLIEEKGFLAVALEADWPDAACANRWVNGLDSQKMDPLREFQRFPKWMWKNTVMPPFLRWLREHNATKRPEQKVGIYGMDLYSLHRSAAAVVEFLKKVDPCAAHRAKEKYNCFDRFGEDTTSYAWANMLGINVSCEKEVLEVLRDLAAATTAPLAASAINEDSRFEAEMNALTVRDAEKYYRTMMREDEKSWNIRDEHFVMVLQKMAEHLQRKGQEAKIVVWAHNSHIGDARATDMGKRRGEVNVGQLCRQVFGEENVFNVGFLGSKGTVTAADAWDEPARVFELRPPIPGSLERLLGENMLNHNLLITHRLVQHLNDPKPTKVPVDKDLVNLLNQPRYQRFVGVLYKPLTERQSHYSICETARQYDAIVHLANTSAIKPLEPEDKEHEWKVGDPDETFPFGL
ncbi:hypothetical protein FN846DRAFT_817669 [Sphaerosporella brunnea]|uniref:Erythromycin esterase n=1 Tax=Sphaerosporella brunnea TaxID=1250544 RepID=A0A5J5ELF9_9PEZI|nr:hypothetical protein FN846DRAFT_817669 [Sphaerosporella brunnea]